MRLIMLLLALCLLAGNATHAAAKPELAIKGDALVIAATGKKVATEIEKAENAPLRFACVDASAAKPHKIAPGVYVFDASGKQVLHFWSKNTAQVERVGGLFFAPGGKLMAVDTGSGHVRDLNFMSFPDGKPVGKPLTYFTGEHTFVWRDKDSVLAMVVGPDAEVRGDCGFEVCEMPISVASYTPASGTHKQFYPFDPLCNYMLAGYKDNVLTVTKECRTVEQWKNPDVPEPTKQTLTYTFTSK